MTGLLDCSCARLSPTRSSPAFAGKSPRTQMGHIRSAVPPASIGDLASLHLWAGEPARPCANRLLPANGVR
jgi:hypothetical protein